MLNNQEVIAAIKHREYTYAILRDGKLIFNFSGSGIGAVAKTIKVDSSMIKDSVIYDTYVGKAVASLLLKYGVKAVYGESMTQVAIDIFKENNIEYQYGEIVPMIYNHDESAECPFEVATKNVEDLDEIERLVFEVIAELKAKEGK